jgi:hypothetical protein
VKGKVQVTHSYDGVDCCDYNNYDDDFDDYCRKDDEYYFDDDEYDDHDGYKTDDGDYGVDNEDCVIQLASGLWFLLLLFLIFIFC